MGVGGSCCFLGGVPGYSEENHVYGTAPLATTSSEESTSHSCKQRSLKKDSAILTLANGQQHEVINVRVCGAVTVRELTDTPITTIGTPRHIDADLNRRYSQTQQLLREKKFAEGVQILTQILQQDPTHYKAYYCRSLCHSGVYKFHFAIDDAEKSLRIRDTAKGHFALARGTMNVPGPFQRQTAIQHFIIAREHAQSNLDTVFRATCWKYENICREVDSGVAGKCVQ
jgi:hypothetical protein